MHATVLSMLLGATLCRGMPSDELEGDANIPGRFLSQAEGGSGDTGSGDPTYTVSFSMESSTTLTETDKPLVESTLATLLGVSVSDITTSGYATSTSRMRRLAGSTIACSISAYSANGAKLISADVSGL